MNDRKKDIILLKINGELKDLSTSISEGSPVNEVDALDPVTVPVYRHSTSHVLAQAVLQLYPDVKIGIGPSVENGFYYDFLTPKPFTPEDLLQIEKRMKHLIKQNQKIEHHFWTKSQAMEYFKNKGQQLKVELINEKIEDDNVSVYQQGEFVDVCRGPHLPSTGYLKNFKLLSVAAAYWKGDETSHSMQRIYGTAFSTEEELQKHLKFLKEAETRDHRKVGNDLDLFSIQNDIGAGLVLWHPKGGMVRYEIEKYWREEHMKAGYDMLYTPHIAKLDLWATSGHLDFYKDYMFPTMEFDHTKYQLKPMNCPFHIAIFKSRNRTYREMPYRWAELGTVYRYERSGVLHGLMRVRGFTQDDAHIFCTPEGLKEEIDNLITFSLRLLKTFGFQDVEVYLSTRPEKYAGTLDDWKLATEALENSLKGCGVRYQVDPGEGVFYGPKIDIKIKDVLKRSWQCTTIQVDFNNPKKFNLKYSDNTGKISQPIMIHRALLGSIERFFGVLIENYGGFFPLWLAPVQAKILPVTDRNIEFARKIQQEMRQELLRVELDDRSEGIGKKIRDAEVQKIAYMLIVGDDEEKEKGIALRIHKKGDQGKIKLDQLIKQMKEKIEKKSAHDEV